MSKLFDMSSDNFEELVNSGKFHEVSAQPHVGEQKEVRPAKAQTFDISSPPPREIQPVVLQPSAPSVTYSQGNKYAGDYIDNEPIPDGGYQAMAFRSPAHVLAAFSDEIQSGQVSLHKWQAEVCMELSPEERPTSMKPLRYYLVAANGSGKDAFVIAPFAIWFILAKVKSRVIITSASGTQLTSQTENYIRALAEKINVKLGQPIFKIRQRYIRCNTSGSEIRMFATDEAGKAEGYHPLEPNAEMAIIKNESKSISEEIHKALKRCSGFNYWLEISSPGAPKGAFYRAASTWKNGRRITSFDCPHISDEERAEDKIDLGESSAEYRSKHLALFTSIDGEVVITTTIVEKCMSAPPTFIFPSWPKRVGIDLAAGGDENGVTITKGPKVLLEKAFAEKDTTVAADRIEQILLTAGIAKDHDFIFADDGGVGHAIIDMLAKRGWNIKRVLNQSAAYNKKMYGNKGAENWFRVKRILEEQMFDLRGLSQKTVDQLTNRKYKQPAGGRLFLQSKREAKSEGMSSPDRADAFVLSLTGLTINDFLSETEQKEDDAPKRKRLSTTQEVQEYYEGITFQEYEMIQNNAGGKQIKARGSLQVILGGDASQPDYEYGQN